MDDKEEIRGDLAPLLGRGGQGEVRAISDQRLPRLLARKHLSPHLSRQPAARERFHREAATLAQLEHPGIPTIHEVGEDEAGPYYTMGLIEGQTLSGALDRSQQELLSAFRQICQTIEYAHGKGVLHRDLKPSNIMLGPHGRVYVLDWGISRVEGLSPLSLPERDWGTLTAGVLGTPGYLAPEQARGEAEQGRGVDVWGLGGLLCFITCGRPPISGGTDEERLERAQRAQLDPWPPDLPAPLRSLLSVALHADPRQRYPSAAALLRDLDAWRADEPMLAHRPGTWERIGRLLQRHGRRLALVGLALLLSLAFGLRSQSQQELARAEIRVSEAARLSVLAWERAQQRDLGGILLAAESLRLQESPRARGALIALRPERLPEDLWRVVGWALMRSPQRRGAQAWWGMGEWQGLLSGDFSAGSLLQRSSLGALNVRDWWPSPDGTQMAVAVVGESPARIYGSNGRWLRRLEGHAESVFDIVWGGDGRIYTVDSAAQVRAFDPHGRLLWSQAAPRGSEGLAWGPSRLTIASPSQGIHAMDPATGAALPSPAPLALGHGRLSPSQDGRKVAAGVIMGGISQVTILEDGQLRGRFPTLSPPADLAWSPDGRWLAIGEEGGKVLLWDAEAGQALLRWSSWDQALRGLVWSADGRRLLAGNYGGGAVLHDLTGLELGRPSQLHRGRVVALSLEEGRLLSLGAEGSLRASSLPLLQTIWEVKVGEDSTALGPAVQGAVDVVVGPGEVGRYRVDSGQNIGVWQGASDRLYSIGRSPDGQGLALSRVNGPPQLVDRPGGQVEVLRDLQEKCGRGGTLYWSAEPDLLLYLGDGGICRRQASLVEEVHSSDLALISRSAASRSGRRFLVMDQEGRLLLLDARGELISGTRWPDVRPSALTVDEEQGLVAVATVDGRLLLSSLKLVPLAEWPLPAMGTSLLVAQGRLWVGTVEGQVLDYALGPLSADPEELARRAARRLRLGAEGSSLPMPHWSLPTQILRHVQDDPSSPQ